MCKSSCNTEGCAELFGAPRKQFMTNDACISGNTKVAAYGEKSEVLAQLANRLDVIVHRIRGVPIGQELADIAHKLREESDNFGNGTATELCQTVVRLREEREEVRQAFARHVAFAAERDAAHKIECERLREEATAGRPSPEMLRAEFSLALEEEAAAARAARNPLIAEIEALKSELTTERSTVHFLRAQLIGIQALQGTRVASSEHSSVGGNIGIIGSEQSMPVDGTPGNVQCISDNRNNTSSFVIAQAGEAHPRSQIPSDPQVQTRNRGRHKHLPQVDSLELTRARRGIGFVERDFAPRVDTEPLWKAELATLIAVQPNLS